MSVKSFNAKIHATMDLVFGTDGNPVIDQLSEEGFVDLAFFITEFSEDVNHYRLHLGASHNNQVLGFDVILVKGIESGFDASMNLIKEHVYRQGVRFLRTGVESDRLVSALGQFYGADPIARKMVSEESFTAIALHQGDLDFENAIIKLKLFGKDSEPFDQGAYYESYFNVDLTNRLVYWNEKDPDYRQPLLTAITAE